MKGVGRLHRFPVRIDRPVTGRTVDTSRCPGFSRFAAAAMYASNDAITQVIQTQGIIKALA